MNRVALTVFVALLAVMAGAPADAGVNIAPKPLSLSTGQAPNILIILDNSQSMVENLDGQTAASCGADDTPTGPGDFNIGNCVAGAASPLSKSEMIRNVGRRLVNDYRGNVHLGLMAYQQLPLNYDPGSTNWTEELIPVQIRNRFYDVTYNPGNFNPNFEFDVSNWDSTTKRFSATNPADVNNPFFFNIALPGYSATTNQARTFCTDREGTPDIYSEPFRFRCFADKVGTNDGISGGTGGGSGYSNFSHNANGGLNDSARARGVTHWGRRMVALPFTDQFVWYGSRSPGLSYLHAPIRKLDDDHAQWLGYKLGRQPDVGNINPFATETPVIVAGLTPLEGTLLTTSDYFRGASTHFGSGQGRGNADAELPESCGVNAAIWLTDGMPSVSRSGVPLGEDVEQALADAVAAAEVLHGGPDDEVKVDVYVVGFSMPPNVPDDALEQLATAGGTGLPFLANNPDELFGAVNEIFQQIIADSQAESGTASSGAVLLSGNLAFRTIADPSDWTGDIVGVRNPDAPNEQVQWRASEEMPAGRTLLTHGGVFNAGNSELIQALHDDEEVASDIVNYILGDTSLESQNGGPFQNRSTLIGAIVGSQPAVQRQVNFAWDRLPEGEPGAGTYNSHVEAKAGLDDVLYVGSNAGVLHAINAHTGEEMFGYVPRGVWPRLSDVASPVPDFTYTADGSVVVADAFLPSRGGWRTVLVGSLGAGGKSIFAIDVTNPSQVNASSVLWEITADDLADAGDLGYTFSTPKVARLQNGQWAAIVGNGYGSGNNDARLLMINLATGVVHGNVLAASGSEANPNGLSTPRVARQRPSEFYDRWVYAGDLHGNLWRFDLDNINNAPARVFSSDRPITGAPQTSYPVGGHGFVVSFGTGKFFEVGDNSADGAPNEYFYLLHDFDPEGGAPDLTRGDLVNRSFVGTTTGEQEVIDPEDDGPGWFVNLGSGAKMLFQPRVLAGMVLFSSFTPSPDTCTVGGTNDLYLLNVRSGQGALAASVYPQFTGRVSGIEGPPSRPTFAVREKTVSDPDTGETRRVPEIVVMLGEEAIHIDEHELTELATDLRDGRRTNWLQAQ